MSQNNKTGLNKDSISALAAEAENKPLEFNPVERSAYIRKNIQQVKDMARNGYDKDTIKNVFPDFAEQYPQLFDMILKPGGFNEKSLGLMINMLDKMGTGQTSQHQASIKVGQHLMNEYVKPILPPENNN
jgi:hypothetical protein